MADKALQQGSFDQVNYPDEIRSGGLGPCIAVGIFHPSKATGYMFHAAAPHLNTLLEEFLRHVVSETKNSKSLRIYICGASIEDEDEEEEIEQATEARHYVESLVRKTLNTAKITISWAKDNVTSELILNTETGKFSEENINNSGLLEEAE